MSKSKKRIIKTRRTAVLLFLMGMVFFFLICDAKNQNAGKEQKITQQQPEETASMTHAPEETEEPDETKKPEETKKPKKTKKPEATKKPKEKSTSSTKITTQGPSNEIYVDVLIMTTGFASYYHQSVCITCDKSFTVKKAGKEKQYKAGKKVKISVQEIKKGKKVLFTPAEGGRLQILSITRQDRNPAYRGTLRLTRRSEGMLVTNHLLMEEYLYAVVPSELPTANKMEALKAQAVCARSYACNQIASGRYKQYNADLDDSVSCQVYNNVPEDERSRKAVDATEGQVLTRNKKIVQAYYYATSWGYSASGQDVWNTASEIKYLKEKLQITEKSRKKTGIKDVDLSSEGQFEDFISNPFCDTWDSGSEWYRWEVTISAKSLSARIDSAVASCYASDSDLILTQKKNGNYKKEVPKALGSIRKLRVEKREKSGLVTELVIVGKNNVIKVCSQYNIRKVLAPIYEKISYASGEAKTTMSLLPSAAFYISDAVKDDKQIFIIQGGGFGHGAGMSQSGAAAMAKAGNDYQDILFHYYQGTRVRFMSDLDWQNSD